MIRGENGVYPGVRVENIAYPQTITALQGAFGLCLSCGDLPLEILQPSENHSSPMADEETWRHWVKAQGWNIKWTYSDQLSADLIEQLTEFRNPLTVIHNRPESDNASIWSSGNTPDPQSTTATKVQSGPNEMLNSLFIDAVQPEYDRARRSLLTKLIPDAYTPNSDFPVSALLETDKGLVGGVNVEFGIWNFGLCAERNAIHTAIAYGARPTGSIAVFAPKSQLCSPCGMCRQTLSEWPLMERVLLYHGDGSSSEHRIKDLLPLHFQASSLGIGPE